MKTKIENRYEFAILMDIVNGNPNGDPNAGNMPRIDMEDSHGLITNVSIKSKIRKFIDLKHEGQDGYNLYIKGDEPLNTKDEKAFSYLGIKSKEEAIKKMKKENPNLDKELQDFMCENFYDVRAFGAVMTTFVKNNLNSGQLRGPVQINCAKSINPIFPTELLITRSAITTAKDFEEKSGEFGKQYIVPYGLYIAHGFINANLANQTGFSEEDLEELWEAILNMFEHDRSSVRGLMSVRKLIIFKHNSKLGNCPAYRLFDSIKISSPQNGVPRQFSDYKIEIDKNNIPNSVELIEKV